MDQVRPGGAGRLDSAAIRLRRVPRSVWAITALHLALLVLWTQLVPTDQAPDEAGHAALVTLVADGHAYPDYDEFHPRLADVRSSQIHRAGVAARGGPLWLTPEDAPPRGRRATVEDLGGDEAWPYANQLSQHPPLYYEVAARVVEARRLVLGRDQPLDRDRMVLRLFSVALVAPLPLLAWAAAHRLGLRRAAAIGAAAFPLAVPQLSHIGSAIGNDSLLVLFGGLLSVVVAGIVRGDTRTRTAVVAGVVTGLALWTKAHAFAFPPWLLIAYAAPVWHDRTRWRQQLRSGAIAVGTALAVGSWWWIRNLARHGEISPSILDGAFPPPAGFEPRVAEYLVDNVPRFAQRFWGSFGSYVAPIPPALVAVATGLTIAACLLAFVPRRGSRLVPVTGRVRLAALGAVVPGLAVLVLVNAWRHYRDSGLPAAVQGRYLFAAIVPLAVLTAVGVARVAGRWTPSVNLAAAIGLQVAGVHAALGAFWAEPSASTLRSAEAAIAWSPLPQVASVGVAALVTLLAGLAFVVVRRDAVTPP